MCLLCYSQTCICVVDHPACPERGGVQMARRHSHAYHDGVKGGRELKRRGGILKSAAGSRLANQVCEN